MITNPISRSGTGVRLAASMTSKFVAASVDLRLLAGPVRSRAVQPPNSPHCLQTAEGAEEAEAADGAAGDLLRDRHALGGGALAHAQGLAAELGQRREQALVLREVLQRQGVRRSAIRPRRASFSSQTLPAARKSAECPAIAPFAECEVPDGTNRCCALPRL
jgi:hypothetical protein